MYKLTYHFVFLSVPRDKSITLRGRFQAISLDLGIVYWITLEHTQKDLTFVRKSDIIMLSYLPLRVVEDNTQPFYDCKKRKTSIGF